MREEVFYTAISSKILDTLKTIHSVDLLHLIYWLLELNSEITQTDNLFRYTVIVRYWHHI
jgi:hypothetical protein